MTFTSLKFILLVLCLYACTATGQTILVNGQATEVEILDKNLRKVKEKVNGYMVEYQSPSNDKFTKVSPRLNNQVQIKPAQIQNEIVLSSTISNLKTVSFEGQSSDINMDGKKFLDDIINTIKSGKSSTILLKTWYTSGDKSDIAITRNRLEACKRYLESEGIVSNLILTSMVAKEGKSSDIAVFMK